MASINGGGLLIRFVDRLAVLRHDKVYNNEAIFIVRPSEQQPFLLRVLISEVLVHFALPLQ